jgi:hypothetical protein
METDRVFSSLVYISLGRQCGESDVYGVLVSPCQHTLFVRSLLLTGCSTRSCRGCRAGQHDHITGMIDVRRSLFQLGPYPGRNSPAQGLSEHRSSQDAHIHPHLARDERSSTYVCMCGDAVQGLADRGPLILVGDTPSSYRATGGVPVYLQREKNRRRRPYS